MPRVASFFFLLRRDPDDAADAWHDITTLFDRIGITVTVNRWRELSGELYAVKITYRNKSTSPNAYFCTATIFTSN